MVGYVYQVRIALVESLRRLRTDPSFSIEIERLDDVSFEASGKPLEILQVKHHLSRTATLTDASPDIWKSMRIWLEGRANGSVSSDARPYLVTTAQAAPGSAAALLRTGESRDVAAARSKLEAAAQTSTNSDTVAGRQAFLALTTQEQEAFLERVVVLDQFPAISSVDAAVEAEVLHAADAAHLAALAGRLEGWWLRRVVQQLGGGGPILSQELHAQVSDLREQFKRDNLPIDHDILDDFDDASLADRPFVEQLRLANIHNYKRLLFAMHDYFRAFQQRSRWMREDLLMVGDVEVYETRLREEWERRFERMKDDLGIEAAEDDKRRAAAALYGWVEADANFPIRPSVVEPFVTRGSYQMLSDRGHVGWHPEFRDRLRHVFGVD